MNTGSAFLECVAEPEQAPFTLGQCLHLLPNWDAKQLEKVFLIKLPTVLDIVILAWGTCMQVRYRQANIT